MPVSDFISDVERAATLGLTIVETSYSYTGEGGSTSTSLILSVLQGAREDMKTLLAQRPHSWHLAEVNTLSIGGPPSPPSRPQIIRHLLDR